MSRSNIGVYGLGVMGRNLALNLEEHGNIVSVYNRTVKGEETVVTDFINSEGTGKNLNGTTSIKDFVDTLEKPRKILIMVKAGKAVDQVINELLPYLDNDDILIDGGNSNFKDTERRVKSLRTKGISFVGLGVSGGEEGARYGPSLMPGTTKKAWKRIKEILEPIAAESFDGSPCCSLIGNGGSGHFVKMIHNGIEYADMQLIAEAYHIMKIGLGMSETEISDQFLEWNDGPLASYLFEITIDILQTKDQDGNLILDTILDSAGQKGTGKWTAINALDLGIPASVISEAVFARFVSSLTDLRKTSSYSVTGPTISEKLHLKEMIPALSDSLLSSRMMAHAEGFYMIMEASKTYKWDIDATTIARIWQGGCIIRSELLKSIVAAYEQSSGLTHLLHSPIFANRYRTLQSGWRKCISLSALHGIPIPGMMAALSQYDSLRSHRLPANLIQAQRDYFGAHTYERIDQPRGKFFHMDWKKAVPKRKN